MTDRYCCVPPLSRLVCDEWSHHLHGEESTVGAEGGHLRLLVHPGLGGLPPGAHQRTHLRHLKEAGMIPVTANPLLQSHKALDQQPGSNTINHQNNVSFQRCI